MENNFEIDAPYAIRVKNLAKYYVNQEPWYKFKEKSNHKVLEQVNFDVKCGETVAIIGKNGIGKSTLLQIIAGILLPSSGSIEINGKVASLLELGAGFDVDSNGIDNIHVLGLLYGLTMHEISQKIPEIISFAEIGEFINQPVRNYSSGMFVRLAFSIIAHIEAKILIIDEALAVGDIFFQQKCMRFLRKFQDNGGTILFVSHDLTAVSALCSKTLLLYRNKENGFDSIFGDTKEIVKIYVKNNYDNDKVKTTETAKLDKTDANFETIINEQKPSQFIISELNSEAESFGSKEVKLLNSYFSDNNLKQINNFLSGDKIGLVIIIQCLRPIACMNFAFLLKDKNGTTLFSESTSQYDLNLNISENKIIQINFKFSMPRMLNGDYILDITVSDGTTYDHRQLLWLYSAFRISVSDGKLVQGIFAPNDFEINLMSKGCLTE